MHITFMPSTACFGCPVEGQLSAALDGLQRQLAALAPPRLAPSALLPLDVAAVVREQMAAGAAGR